MPKRPQPSPATQAAIIQETALLRLYQILGDPTRGIAPLVPVGRTTWMTGIKEGRFPKPVKYGRSVFWKKSDITALLEKISGGQ